MNCLALETDGGIVVIDAGITFPTTEPGVERVVPDFRYLVERRDRVVGIVATHGHEDHIGALPFLCAAVPAPVWAPPLAVALAAARIAEHDRRATPDLRAFRAGETIRVGPFEIEAIEVTHSIPDCLALCITVGSTRIVHTGDFKLDPEPMDSRPTDLDRLRAIGDLGVDVLLSDSTNIETPGSVVGERAVAAALRAVIEPLDGRVVVALFGSNTHRVQGLVDAAIATGRRIVLFGRSLQHHARTASELGLLRIPTDRWYPSDAASGMPPRTLLALAGGTQAESGSALARMSRGQFAPLALGPSDTVIFSARVIPGHERDVTAMIDALERRGVRVVRADHVNDLHASGHAARDELATMLRTVRPRAFVPVHGTYHHMQAHAVLARELGVEHTHVVEDGQSLVWRNGGLRADEIVPVGRSYVDGDRNVDASLVDARETIASVGGVFATVHVTPTGEVVGQRMEVSTWGVAAAPVENAVLEQGISAALGAAKGARDALTDDEIRTAVRGALRRCFRNGAHRPVVLVHLVRQ